ncbi:MAG: alpha/beta fold hydrolase [Ferruginibacter sp.]
MKNIYVISGLGADERVFYKTDFANNNVVFLKWVLPEKNESIENYSLRLTKKIVHKNPILVGLSFGGMMAMEVAKHITTEKIILISSAKTRHELPPFYRAVGKINLQKIIPSFFLLRANVFSNWAFSNRTLDDKKMLDSMMRETDIVFLKWAIDKILHWQNTTVYKNVVHIHGKKDRILPFKNIRTSSVIENGAHLMIITQAEEVNAILKEILLS